jgi:hypothetical protein
MPTAARHATRWHAARRPARADGDRIPAVYRLYAVITRCRWHSGRSVWPTATAPRARAAARRRGRGDATPPGPRPPPAGRRAGRRAPGRRGHPTPTAAQDPRAHVSAHATHMPRTASRARRRCMPCACRSDRTHTDHRPRSSHRRVTDALRVDTQYGRVCTESSKKLPLRPDYCTLGRWHSACSSSSTVNSLQSCDSVPGHGRRRRCSHISYAER